MLGKLKNLTKKQIIIIVCSLVVVIGSIIGTILITNKKNLKKEKPNQQEICHVQFNTQGGSLVEDIEIKCGTFLEKPETTPTKEGFEFINWYYLDEVFNFEEKIMNDIILDAKYLLVGDGELVKVSFDSQGGSSIEEIEILKGTTITEPISPNRGGHSFEGWYLNDTKFDFTSPINENITLTAKWKETNTEGTNNQINNYDKYKLICLTDEMYKGTTVYSSKYVEPGFQGLAPEMFYSVKTLYGCEISYSSSNPNVATVSSVGLVKAKSEGETTINFCFTDTKTKIYLGCSRHKVIVNKKEIENPSNPSGSQPDPNVANGINFDDIQGKWYKEGTGTSVFVNFITTTQTEHQGITPSLDEDLNTKYNRTFSNFQELVDYYNIKLINNDKMTITRGNKTITLTRNPSVVKVKEITVDRSDVKLYTNTHTELNVYINALYANNTEIESYSNNADVATIRTYCGSRDKQGKIQCTARIEAVDLGNTTAIIKSKDNGAQILINITVSKIEVTGITISSQALSLNTGETKKLTAQVTPNNAANKTINWSSSNPNVATVSSNGIVTALKQGTTIITASSPEGFSKDCTVTVTTPPLTAKSSIGFVRGNSSTGPYYGISVELTPSGGSGIYTYHFIKLYKNNALILQTENTNSNKLFLENHTSGYYNIEYEVRDSEGRIITGTDNATITVN